MLTRKSAIAFENNCSKCSVFWSVRCVSKTFPHARYSFQSASINSIQSDRDSGGAGVLGDSVVMDKGVGIVRADVATDAGEGGGALTFGDGEGYDALVGVSRAIPAPIGTAVSLNPRL